MPVNGSRLTITKVLVFSVKGEDLLFLDYANSRLTAAQRALYARLGLPAAPFGNVSDTPAGQPPRPYVEKVG